MTIRYLEDLLVSHISDSWFLLKSNEINGTFLYNNESCELGILPAAPEYQLEEQITNIVKWCHFSHLKDFAGVRDGFSVWFLLRWGTTWNRSFSATAPVI